MYEPQSHRYQTNLSTFIISAK